MTAIMPISGVHTGFYHPQANVIVELLEYANDSDPATSSDSATTEPQRIKHEFHVLFAKLTAASPIWRLVLDPETRFRQPELRQWDNGNTMQVIHIHDADPGIVDLLFKVLHHHTPEQHGATDLWDIPRQIDIQTLYEFSVLIDEFDCFAAVRQWTDQWLSELDDQAINLPTDLERWATIERNLRGNRELRDMVQARDQPLAVITRLMVMHMKSGWPGQLQLSPIPGGFFTLHNCRARLAVVDRYDLSFLNLQDTDSLAPLSLDANLINQAILSHITTQHQLFLEKGVAPLYRFIQNLIYTTPAPTDAIKYVFCRNKACRWTAHLSLTYSLAVNDLGFLTKHRLEIPTEITPLGFFIRCRDLELKTLVFDHVGDSWGSRTRSLRPKPDHDNNEAYGSHPGVRAREVSYKEVPAMGFMRRGNGLTTPDWNVFTGVVRTGNNHCGLAVEFARLQRNLLERLRGVRGYVA